MARIDKGALTKLEIITEATKQFLEKGYTNTSANAVAKALGMSQGNLTFHYPTKEHLLAILVVFCKHFLDKVAKHFWTLLQVQIGQSCKASTGSYPASRIAIADHI